MAIVINGSGTVTGISVGGLPDDIVDAGTLADNAVGLAQMAGGTDGNIITYDTSGNPAVVATGSDGQVLTSAGADAVPAFEAVAGIDCDADAWHYYMGTSQENSSAAVFDIGTAVSTGSNITESGGVITVGTAGWYLITVDAGNWGNDSTATDTHIRKNNTNIANSRIYWANAASYAGKSRTIIIEASASDTFDVYGTGYWYGDSDTMVGWTGVRIGA